MKPRKLTQGHLIFDRKNDQLSRVASVGVRTDSQGHLFSSGSHDRQQVLAVVYRCAWLRKRGSDVRAPGVAFMDPLEAGTVLLLGVVCTEQSDLQWARLRDVAATRA